MPNGAVWGKLGRDEKDAFSFDCKLGPGEYRPDVAFTRLEDLPVPKIIKQRRYYAHRPCPQCGQPADRVFTQQVHDLGD